MDSPNNGNENSNNAKPSRPKRSRRRLLLLNRTLRLCLVAAFCGSLRAAWPQPRGKTNKATTTTTTLHQKQQYREQEEKDEDRSSPRTYYYTVARKDGAGSVLSDMLNAHAYAFAHNGTYGGACDDPEGSNQSPPTEHRQRLIQLVRDVGLQRILAFACPPSNASATSNEKHVWLSKRLYKATWKKRYINYLQQKVDWDQVKAQLKGDEDDEGGDDNIFRIAVHLRRGDVTPCNGWQHRYLPNSHYLRVLDAHVPDRPRARVYVFSEANSSEPWDAFAERNYTMMLDASVAETWARIMTADMVLVGWSTFSLFPATFNRNPSGVLYTPFNRPPSKGWTSLNRTFVDWAMRDKALLKCDEM
jgi:hypothetical protein